MQIFLCKCLKRLSAGIMLYGPTLKTVFMDNRILLIVYLMCSLRNDFVKELGNDGFKIGLKLQEKSSFWTIGYSSYFEVCFFWFVEKFFFLSQHILFKTETVCTVARQNFEASLSMLKRRQIVPTTNGLLCALKKHIDNVQHDEFLGQAKIFVTFISLLVIGTLYSFKELRVWHWSREKPM